MLDGMRNSYGHETCTIPMGVRGTSSEENLLDKGSYAGNNESQRLYDLEYPALVEDQKPGQLFIVKEDRWMKMNSRKVQRAHSAPGIEP